MKIEDIKEIANAILYEGYLLYPYRHSALKNRQRWTFGVLYPRAYSEANGSIEPWNMQTECLLEGQADTMLTIQVRFLHLLLRTAITSQDSALPTTKEGSASSMLQWTPTEWEEGLEREIREFGLSLADLLAQPKQITIAFPGGQLTDAATATDPSVVRVQQPIAGVIQLAAEQVSPTVYKLTVQIQNTTAVPAPESADRNAILLQSFVSTHTILHVQQGHFISLLDPPADLPVDVAICHNLRTWPVLVGAPGELHWLLSSPIILYDYPQIAPESVGSLFDGTEIDEILTLRILTLSDEEKQAIRQGDERARQLLERTEALTSEQLMKLHGTLHTLQADDKAQHSADTDEGPPLSILIAGQEVKAGQRVRLRPSVRADAFDLLLAGKTARVEVIQQDLENRLYLVVTLDEDPGREQWDERILPGHRFFFYPQEIELLEAAYE